MQGSIRELGRRTGAVVALLALVAAFVVATPGAATASTGGTATATGVDVNALAVSVGGTTIFPGVSATLAEASAPPPPTGIDQDIVDIGVGPVELGALDARVDRSTSGLHSSSSLTDLTLTLLGTEVLGADVVSSWTDCPIPGAGFPSSGADVANLTIGGNPASVGATDTAVSLGNLGRPLLINSARFDVTVTQSHTATATTADATGLIVAVDLVIDFRFLPDVDFRLLDLKVAETGCTQPAGILPTALAIDPASGIELTPVTITGTDFVPGYTTVDFGGTSVTPTDVTYDGTSLAFVVPENSPLGDTEVRVTTPAGTSDPLSFVVLASPPTATGISPDHGPEGTTVTITGTEFVPGATTVAIAGSVVDAADVDVAPGGASLTFEVPPGAPLGPTSATVTTPGGTTSPPLAFLVTGGVPVALDIDPDVGPIGTTVTITGSGFVPTATSVGFGALTVEPGDVDVAADGTSLTFVVPPGAPLGPTDVTVTTPDGSSDPLGFVVSSAVAPTVLAIDPEMGPVGTTVTITGSDLVPGATSVGFGALTVEPGDVDVAADGTSLTFVVPPGAPLGPTDVTVTTPAGTGGPLDFLVLAASAPAIDGIDPSSGPVGTTVTVDGSGFVPGATTVHFGDTVIPADEVVVSNDGTTLTFTVPPGSALGATPVSVETPTGSSGAVTFTVTEVPAGGGGGGGPATPASTSGALPYTGGRATTQLVGLGLLLLAAGAVLALTPGLRPVRLLLVSGGGRGPVPAPTSAAPRSRSVVTAGLPRWMAVAVTRRAGRTSRP